MVTKELIFKEIKSLPDYYLEEILDFIRFLETKIITQKKDVTLLSETSLGKDWLKPEEDEAWKDL